MEDDLKRVESILFTTGRFLSLEEISSLCEIASIGYLKELLENLRRHYSEIDSALEVVNQGNRWKLAIRKDYMYLTEKLLTDSELDRPTQETLAVIAYKQPVLQSDVIKIRGNGAYDHVKNLKEHDFITAEKSGRTKILKLTSKFFDYFDVVEDTLKSKFKPDEGIDMVRQSEEFKEENGKVPEE